MTDQVDAAIAAARIVPVIAVEDADDAVPLCTALAEGGLKVAEITFRTAAAPEAIRRVAAELPEVLLGAGTVTTVDEAKAAADAGATFSLAPGCNPAVIAASQAAGVPFFPGVCTPSDIERALDAGCTTLKFFPAEAAGGRAMLAAMYAPYKHRGIRFVPTGGVSPSNLRDWLGTAGVIACGGTWMVTKDLIAAKNWSEITRLTAEAMALAAQ